MAEPPKDEVDDKRLVIFGYKPGEDTRVCFACKQLFKGDKYATVCKPCASARWDKL